MATPTLTIPLKLWWSERARTLSERERAIVMLVACGFDNREIAAIEGVEVSTVRSQLHSVMNKLNCRNRTQLAMMALFAGLVDTDVLFSRWEAHAPEMFD